MDYTSFCIIIGILFWILAAASVVLLGAWVYIQAMYYHWSKQDRELEDIVDRVRQIVDETVSAVKENSEIVDNDNN